MGRAHKKGRDPGPRLSRRLTLENACDVVLQTPRDHDRSLGRGTDRVDGAARRRWQRLQRQLQAPAHRELRRHPALATQRPQGLGRHRADRDRGRARPGHRSRRTARVDALLARVAAAPHVSIVSSPFAPGGAGQIAPSGRVAFANVTFDVPSNKVSAAAAKRFVSMVTSPRAAGSSSRSRANRREGAATAAARAASCSASWPRRGPVHRFGSLLAMLLPLVTAGSRWVPASRRRAAVACDQHGFVLRPARAADRARRRHRLRAVHRHPLPAGIAARPVRARRRWSSRSTLPGAR